jgi:hypothetical protein
MVSVKRSELVSRVETAANLGFLVAIPAMLLTAGVAMQFPGWLTLGQFAASLGLLGLAIGTFKRHRSAAVGQVVVFAGLGGYILVEELRSVLAEPAQRPASLLVIGLVVGLGFLLVRGARAVFVLHAVKQHPIPRESRYAFRPTTETVVIR